MSRPRPTRVLALGILTIVLLPPIGAAGEWVADRYCDWREARGFVPFGRRG